MVNTNEINDDKWILTFDKKDQDKNIYSIHSIVCYICVQYNIHFNDIVGWIEGPG